MFVVVLFIVTLVMVKVNSDTWQLEFLVVTLAVVVLLNIFSATFQGGLFGLAGCFPPRYLLTQTSSRHSTIFKNQIHEWSTQWTGHWRDHRGSDQHSIACLGRGLCNSSFLLFPLLRSVPDRIRPTILLSHHDTTVSLLCTPAATETIT